MRTTQQYSITLPLGMAEEIERKIESGNYASVSEVMRDGLRALFERDAAIERWLHDEVGLSFDEYKADPASAIPADQVMDRLRERAAARRAASSDE